MRMIAQLPANSVEATSFRHSGNLSSSCETSCSIACVVMRPSRVKTHSP